MRLSGTNELVAIGVVILVTCFFPGLVSPLVQSKVGKALALAATAWVALNVSQPLALFLAVLIICARSGGTEYMIEYMKHDDKKEKKPADEPNMPSPM
jgi:phosphatidylglycerophosphatase A